ncbi:transmembrane protein 182-like isoform X2 [Epinephelus fuscoguttatus]|uniref:transmembrane protein 182-like isoform X2 n=1 Tax=Epinephelus fuscoguttatus TaxID=293821 RepID=UPI0020D0C2E0|nr:transmembrane protein 182-like isoform X2 [Epinephelus fuscoguttatus]
MSPAERLKVLLFLALFFGAIGFLFTLLSCGTEYWLLATESCSQPEVGYGGRGLREGKSSTKAIGGVRIFHEGLFWRCSFTAVSDEHTIWDLWISNQPPSKVCHTAFLFPFPVYEPMQSRGEPHGFPANPYEHHSAIVFRTFWSIFLVTGLAAVIIGGFVVICAGPLTNHRLFKVGGALLFCGGLCLLAVVVMYVMWIQVLDTLEQFALHQRVSTCPSFHLSVQHGPSFLLATVAVFFCLLAGVLFILIGRSIQGIQMDKRGKIPDLPTSDVLPVTPSVNTEDSV